MGAFLAFALTFTCNPAAAYTFIPTADDWATWPAYCRARYDSIEFSSTTDFANLVPKEEIDHWHSVLGETFLSIHHYCTGIIIFRQAMADPGGANKQFHLNDASAEVKYTLDRIEMTDPMAPEVASLYAQIRVELGNVDQAEAVISRVMQAQPEADRPYLVLAAIKRRSGSTQGAIDVLEEGNRRTGLKSAEINYSLGLLYVDRHEYDAASECADRAYSLGYPLPGLRNKLKQAGH